MIRIICYTCGLRDEMFFSPPQRIDDKKVHVCWDCENKTEKGKIKLEKNRYKGYDRRIGNND